MTKHKKSQIDHKEIVLEKIKENYPSLILGFSVILVLISIIIKLWGLPKIKLSSLTKKITKPSPVSLKKQEKKVVTYQIKEGDTLWSIAEKYFGSGFNASDIASANNLKNPDLIEINQKIVIPSITPKQLTKGVIVEAKTERVTLREEKYLVKEGDFLWKIALEAYGDGYAWVKIASINNLANPNLIYPGDILKILR